MNRWKHPFESQPEGSSRLRLLARVAGPAIGAVAFWITSEAVAAPDGSAISGNGIGELLASALTGMDNLPPALAIWIERGIIDDTAQYSEASHALPTRRTR